MSKVTLDFTSDTNLTDFANTLAKDGLTLAVLRTMGPAGGNPEVEIEGPREALVAFMNEVGYEDLTDTIID